MTSIDDLDVTPAEREELAPFIAELDERLHAAATRCARDDVARLFAGGAAVLPTEDGGLVLVARLRQRAGQSSGRGGGSSRRARARSAERKR